MLYGTLDHKDDVKFFDNVASKKNSQPKGEGFSKIPRVG